MNNVEGTYLRLTVTFNNNIDDKRALTDFTGAIQKAQSDAHVQENASFPGSDNQPSRMMLSVVLSAPMQPKFPSIVHMYLLGLGYVESAEWV